MRTLPVFTAALLFSITVSGAQEAAPPGAGNLRQLLQQGLFEEEANRDAGKAAAAYSAIVAEYETQRSFAATALFRLAEIRAKQGKKEEAIALHQRLLTEFPKSEDLGKLSKERIAALGGMLPATASQADAPTDAEAKELIQLREIVQNSPDLLNASGGEENTTPLIRAASKGWLIAAAFLLDHGADANHVDGGVFPLQAAALHGHKRMVELLLARGADVNRKNAVDETALYKACESNRLEVARVLLEHGADPNATSRYEATITPGTPLHAAISLQNLPLLRLLLDHKADPNGLNASGNPPLAAAVTQKNETIVKELLARGADVNVASREKGPVLHIALRTDATLGTDGWPEIVPLLLEHGASVRAVVPSLGQTPLHLAMTAFPTRTVSRPGALTRLGERPEPQMLKGAELTQLYRLWDALLAKGSDINARDTNETTPLLLAATRPDLPVDALMWLVEHGANLDAKDKNGGTVFGYARASNFERGMELERRYRFCQWATADAITVLNYCTSNTAQSLTIPRTADAEAAPTVRDVLVKVFENLRGAGPSDFGVRIYRAQENGEFVELARTRLIVGTTDVDSVKLPPLQWGEILVLEPEENTLGGAPARRIKVLDNGSKDRILNWLRSPSNSTPEPNAASGPSGDSASAGTPQ